MRGCEISGVKTALSQNKIRAQSWAGLCCKRCGNFVGQKYEPIVEYCFEHLKVESTFHETIIFMKLVCSDFAKAMSGTWSYDDCLWV